MNTDDYALHLRSLRDLTANVPVTASSDDLLRLAEDIQTRLSSAEKAVAATLYLTRLLKDSHRQAVVSVERTSVGRRIVRTAQTPEEIARNLEARATWEQESSERAWKTYADVKGVMDTLVSDLKMQWTEELLSSTFAMPDGSHVAWGEATVEQHEVRREMLLGNAKGNIEAAARHELAIKTLKQAHVDRLYDAQTAVA